GLDRYIHRRVSRRRMRPRRARRRGCPDRAGRDHRRGRALCGRRACAVSALAAGADAAASRRVRRRHGGAAAGAVTYVERTQIGRRPPLSPPARELAGATLAIDQATRSNLELVRTLAGERRGSLLAAIDRTVTAAGSRLLAQRLAAPLTDPAE